MIWFILSLGVLVATIDFISAGALYSFAYSMMNSWEFWVVVVTASIISFIAGISLRE